MSILLSVLSITMSPPMLPPSIPNNILELTGCPTTHEVLGDLRVTVSDSSLSTDDVLEEIRSSIHSNINANTDATLSLKNVVVSTNVQSGVNRPPTPPRPPELPP